MFVNFVDGEYDRVATQASPFFAKHLGHMLLLDDSNFLIGYPGYNTGGIVRNPQSYRAHAPERYLERLEFIRNRGCFPVPVGKWEIGHRCNYDDECDSGNCRKRLGGDGKCERQQFWQGILNGFT